MDKFEKLSLKKFKIKDIVPNATILLLGRRRSGKCLGKGTKVLMYDGTIKNVEDIFVGDLVMGDDSTSRKVLGINNGVDTLYKVLNQKDESYTVNSEHILSLKYTCKKNLRDRKDKNSYQIVHFNKYKVKLDYKTFSYKNKNKEEVYKQASEYLQNIKDDRIVDIPIKNYLKLSKKYKNNLHGYQVPISFPEKNLEIDPYMIGYWIPSSLKASSLRSHIEQIRDLNYKKIIIDKFNNITDSERRELERMFNLNGKHIPIDYKCNSRENRLQLLAGILDADGSYDTGCFKFSQSLKHEKIIDDVIFLARSLGFACYKRIKKTLWTYKGVKKNGEAWRINISGKGIEEIPTKIIKKQAATLPRKLNTDVLISSIKIKELPQNEYYGFELDGNHRFVLDNFIVTHNSYLTRDIFFHHRDIPKGIVFSGTENANPFYGDFIPDTFIHSVYNPELIETVLVNQGKKVREARKLGLGDSGCLPKNRFFIVLDDMLADASAWKKEKTIQEIFFNGRHFNIFFILTMQYALGIPPALRSNIDYIFIFNEPSIKNRKKIYEDYAGVIPSFDHFQNILDSCTQNYECLVIKTSGNSSDIRDQVFWYKALPHDNFKAGHPNIWKYHELKYNEKFNQQRDKKKEDIDKLRHKYANSKKLKIIVNRLGEVVDDYLTEESE